MNLNLISSEQASSPVARALPPALNLSKISKVYPGTIALDRVNLEVLPGEVHGLIGKNGAGKSTLVGIISGLIRPTSGLINIGDKSFSHLTRSQAKTERIAIVTQEPEVILDISVAENLFLGTQLSPFSLINWRHLFKRADEILKSHGLDFAPDYRAGDLSLSERQLLLVIKACVVENARLIILDESSAPLTQKDAGILRNIVLERRRAGQAIIYISHHIDELLDICDRMTVLRDGKSVTTCDKGSLTHHQLSELIVGEPLSAGGPRSAGDFFTGGEEVLKLTNLSKWGAFEKVNLGLRRGEIVGLAGLRGSGRTEIMKAIAGIDPPDEGSIKFKGQKIALVNPHQALAVGISYLPEERESEGLLKGFSISDNITLNSLREISTHGIIRETARRGLSESIFKAVECKAFSVDQAVDELSGGNKQKVLIGRIMALKPDLYLLDEPTKGVDVGAKKSILSLIIKSIRGNAGVLVTSPGLDDLIEICDRILIVCKGRIVGCHYRADFDEKKIFMAIQGLACEGAADKHLPGA